MSDSNIPPYEDTKKRWLAAGLTEELLRSEMQRISEEYGGTVKDPAFLAWLAAGDRNVPVAEIKMVESGGGTPMTCAQINRDLVRRELSLDQNDRTLFQVEGVVVNLREGVSSTGKPKLVFTLVDESGKVTVTAWEKAMPGIINARIADGDYVRVPQANVYAFDTKKPDFWYTMSIPPFEGPRVVRLDKDTSNIFRDVTRTAVKENDAVRVAGIVTNLDEKKHAACSKCKRWYDDEEKDEHKECGQYNVYEQVSYSATIVTGTGQQYLARFSHHTPKPQINVGKDRVLIFGFWTKKGNVAVARYQTFARGAPGPAAPIAPQAPPTPVPEAVVRTTPDPAFYAAPAPTTAAPATQMAPLERMTPVQQVAAPPASSATMGEIPAPFMEHLVKYTKGVGGTNRVLILVNNAVDNTTLLAEIQDKAQRRALFEGYIRNAVAQGTLAYADPSNKLVKWTGA